LLRSFALLLPGRRMETGRTYLHPLPTRWLPMCSLALRCSKAPDRLHLHPHMRPAPLLRSAAPAATGDGRWMDGEGAGSMRCRDRISWNRVFQTELGRPGGSSLTRSAGRMSPIVSQTPVLYQPLTSETGSMQIWRDLLFLTCPGDRAVTKGGRHPLGRSVFGCSSTRLTMEVGLSISVNGPQIWRRTRARAVPVTTSVSVDVRVARPVRDGHRCGAR
jgi:hypothetical protein